MDSNVLENICKRIQSELYDVVSKNISYIERPKTGFVDALQSYINKGNFQSYPKYIDYKRGEIELIYPKNIFECKEGLSLDYVRINKETIDTRDFATVESSVLEFTSREFKQFTSDGNVRDRRDLIFDLMNNTILEMDRLLLKSFFENYINSNRLLIDSINNEVLNKIDKSFLDGSGYIVIGGNDILNYAKENDLTIMNNWKESVSDFEYLYHDCLIQEYKEYSNLILKAGAFQLLNWVDNIQDRAYSPNTFVFDTLIDPITGLAFDIYIIYNMGEDKWEIKLQLKYKLWTHPNN